jgi:hypothetical protein
MNANYYGKWTERSRSIVQLLGILKILGCIYMDLIWFTCVCFFAGGERINIAA